MLTELFRRLDTPDRRVVVLSNGLTVILARHSTARLAAARAYVRAGSALEGRWAGSGLSHLLEHMIAGGGTRGLNEQKAMQRADDVGGLNNAYTTVDHTCFHVTVAPSDLPVAVEMLADWLVRPVLSESLLRRERGVILREHELDAGDAEVRLEDVHRETVYRVHPARYPTIGYPDALRRLRLADVRAYFDECFVPDRMFLVVAGDIDLDAAETLIAGRFHDLQRRPVRPIVLPEEPPIVAPRRAMATMPTASAAMVLSWLTVRPEHRDIPALAALTEILTAGDASRLVRRLRWDDGLVTGITGSHETACDAPGTLEVWMRLDADRADAAESAVLDEIAKLSETGPTKSEMQRASEHMHMGAALAMQTADGMAEALGEWFLESGSTDFGAAFLAAVERLTPADVQAAAARYCRPDACCVSIVMPESSKRVAVSSSPRRGREPILQRRLANGLTTLARQTDSDGLVGVVVVFGGGVLFESAAENGITPLAAEMAIRASMRHTAAEITELFERRSARLTAGSDTDWFGVGCVLRRQHLDELLPVFGELVVAPRFDPADLARIKPAQLDAVDRRDEAWQDELMRWADRCFFGDEPYARSEIGTRQTVESFTPKRIGAFYREACVGGNVVAALCGDLPAEEALQRLEQVLAAVPAGKYRGVPSASTTTRPLDDRLFVVKARADRQVAGVFIGYPGVSIDHPDEAALTVLKTILGGYELSSGRLFQALRGRGQDLVYEVAAHLFGGLRPGYIALTAGCEPSRVSAVYRAIRREVRAIAARSCDAAELARAKAMIRLSEFDRLQTPFELARRSALSVRFGLPADDLEQFLARVDAVAASDVLRVARQYLSAATVVVVTPDPSSVTIGLRPLPVEPDLDSAESPPPADS